MAGKSRTGPLIQLGKQRPESERALPRGTKSVDAGVEMGNGVGGYFGGGEDKDFPVPGMLSLRWLLDTQVAMSDWQLEMEVDSWI